MQNIFEASIFQKNVDSKAEFEENDEDDKNVHKSVSDEMMTKIVQKDKNEVEKNVAVDQDGSEIVFDEKSMENREKVTQKASHKI